MTADDLLAALGLPAATRVDQRVPKKLFLENGAPTAADRRAITEGVEECRWVAALKPHTIGVPDYRDTDREYVEIHVIRLTATPAAKTTRLTELVHRAIPYPLLLVHEQGPGLALSAAHKRHSLGEAGKTVLESPPVAVDVSGPAVAPFRADFAAAIPLTKQPQGIAACPLFRLARYAGGLAGGGAQRAVSYLRLASCSGRKAQGSRNMRSRRCRDGPDPGGGSAGDAGGSAGGAERGAACRSHEAG